MNLLVLIACMDSMTNANAATMQNSGSFSLIALIAYRFVQFAFNLACSVFDYDSRLLKIKYSAHMEDYHPSYIHSIKYAASSDQQMSQIKVFSFLHSISVYL